jgi:hypothetical protein
MPRVKVGLNQWVIANNDGAELVTDGLSGCIGVVIWTDHQICLAHVFSDYSDNRAAYNYQLDLPVAVLRHGGRAIRGCAVVYADDVDLRRAALVRAWCDTLGVRAETYRASGVRVFHTMYGCEIQKKEEDNAAFYRLGMGAALTTVTGVAHITNWGELAPNASEAT